jgi:hypothetical protein
MSLRLNLGGGEANWGWGGNWGRNDPGVSALFILVEVRIAEGTCPPIQSQWHSEENCIMAPAGVIAALDPCSSGSIPFRVSDDLLLNSPTQFEAPQTCVGQGRSAEIQ